MRRTTALVSSVATVAMLTAVLAGCSAAPDDADSCMPLIAPGDASTLVTATGAIGSLPTVDIPTPIVVQASERSVIESGEGLVAREGMTVDYDAVLFDASNGQELQKTSFDDGTAHLSRTGGGGAIWDAFVCAQAGDRLAVATTVGDSGLAGPGATEADLERTLIIVIDIRGVYLGKADGVNQLPQDGLPVVVTAPDGTVGLTVPSGLDVPTTDRTSVIKLGSGDKVAEGDEIVVQQAVWTWTADGSDVAQRSTSWESAPVLRLLTQDNAQAFPSAVHEAIVGLPVGSQVLVALAPESEDADAVVYVVDVLGIRAPAQE